MNSTSTDTMSTLHGILKTIADKQQQLERGPLRVGAHQQRVDGLTAEMETAQQNHRDSRMTSDNKQLQLKTSETKLADLQTKLNTCSSNREYQALLEQIAADQMAESVLEDEILDSLETVDTLGEQVSLATKTVEQAKGNLKEETSKVQAEAEVLRKEITSLAAELSEVETSLPPEIRPDYDRIVKTRKDDSMASVDDGICEGCFQQITPNMIAQLTLKESVICNSCGRLLYPASSD